MVKPPAFHDPECGVPASAIDKSSGMTIYTSEWPEAWRTTLSVWLTIVERRSRETPDKRIRRDIFSECACIIDTIKNHTDNHNQHPTLDGCLDCHRQLERAGLSR